MKRSTLSVAVWLLLVFVSGVLVGVFGQRLYSARTVRADPERRGRPSPEEFRKHMVADMQKRLSLTPQQVEQVNRILDDTRASVDQVREHMRAEMKPIQDNQHDRVRAILDDTQRDLYTKMLAERDDRERENRERDNRERKK